MAAATARVEQLEQQIAERDAAETRQREENKQKPPMSQSATHAPAKTAPLTPSANLDEFDIDDDWDEEDWEVPSLAANKPEPDAHLLFTALETLGRGEDPLTQGIEQTTNNLVRISYQHFPEGTEQVLNALNHINSGIDAVVEFIDDSTANRVSASWQQLDETTQARILRAGKVLSVLVPVARVKALAELTRAPSPALKKDGWHPDSVEARHKEWKEHYGGREDHEYQGISGYIRPPESLKAFPDTFRVEKKTAAQGGGA
ncbi:hypothetical protein [Endozoicomonas numazuensis]|uniref:Uncharacterized protein n=1 Tax=Endozoicomonas numazuensis TaxID=1137799 RepID=A0A081ND92_9GAMM|nr:hypothetical protein [Endozoicomonas numazuensis]KEQ16415.1 hypothetical protein GZ78_21350 [Endozoicomonas numazuensis]